MGPKGPQLPILLGDATALWKAPVKIRCMAPGGVSWRERQSAPGGIVGSQMDSGSTRP